jgi:hypothetical protein
MGKANKTCNLCGELIPRNVVINGVKHQLQRKSCLKCVPWGSGKKGRSNGVKPGTYVPCKKCGREKSHKGNFCNTCVCIKRRVLAKLRAIELLGGKCRRCGWNKHPAGLEFHHPGKDKEFEVGNYWHLKWEKILPEIMKCELICSCCHRIEHSHRFDEFIKLSE